MENIMTCNPLTGNAAISPFARDRAVAMSGAELSTTAGQGSWGNDVSTQQTGGRGIDRVRVVPTSVHSVDSYRLTNVAALAKQGAPPRREPR